MKDAAKPPEEGSVSKLLLERTRCLLHSQVDPRGRKEGDSEVAEMTHEGAEVRNQAQLKLAVYILPVVVWSVKCRRIQRYWYVLVYIFPRLTSV